MRFIRIQKLELLSGPPRVQASNDCEGHLERMRAIMARVSLEMAAQAASPSIKRNVLKHWKLNLTSKQKAARKAANAVACRKYRPHINAVRRAKYDH